MQEVGASMARLMVLEQQGLDATSSKLKGTADDSVLISGSA